MAKAPRYCEWCGSKLEVVTDGRLYRCLAHDCGRLVYRNPTPVVAVIAHRGGEVVMAHNRSWPSGFFAPITGYIEQRESAVEAATRETREELGVELEQPRFIGTYPFHRTNQLIIAYSGGYSGEIQLGDELDDYRLQPFDAVRTWSFGTGLALGDFLAIQADASKY
jgi:NADH pyrophosphatase NudC (nudix superfamily)